MSNRYGKTTYLFTNQEYRLSLFGNAINQEIRSGVVDIRNKNTEIVWNMICRILILRHLGKEKRLLKYPLHMISFFVLNWQILSNSYTFNRYDIPSSVRLSTSLFIFIRFKKTISILTLSFQCSHDPSLVTTYSKIVSSPSHGGRGSFDSWPLKKSSNYKKKIKGLTLSIAVTHVIITEKHMINASSLS